MRIAVAIATTGRPEMASVAVRELRRQSRRPDRVVVCVANPADFDAADPRLDGLPIELHRGRKGLTAQRNLALSVLGDEEAVLFLDDDFIMAPDFLEGLEAVLRAHPDVAMVTGRVLADGIGGAGLTVEAARRLLAAAPDDAPDGSADGAPGLVEVNNGYGCNMAARLDPIRRHGLRFDEALPLYGWLEDIDFSRRLAAHGRCVRADALRGVHLGVKAGRTSGLRLGYSQVANPIYLARRGTMTRRHALTMIARNLAANLARSLRPEPWVDRRGRLRGNAVAAADLALGRLDPRRILALGGVRDARS